VSVSKGNLEATQNIVVEGNVRIFVITYHYLTSSVVEKFIDSEIGDLQNWNFKLF
jgi:hypothetical protein